MTKDEKYVRCFFPNASFYPEKSDDIYLIFHLNGNGTSYELLLRPKTERQMWAIARKIVDRHILDKLTD